MKVAIRAGHNTVAVGASALLDEVTEARNVLVYTRKYLKDFGVDVLDVTPAPCDSDSDLVYGVKKANDFNADLFISIHFNKAYTSYAGAIGTEAYVYSKSDNFKDEVIASRVVNNICKFGFKNRGVKEGNFYELKNTKMSAIILEVCFVEATEDVALYQKVGIEAIGKCIAEGIVDKTSSNVTTPVSPSKPNGDIVKGKYLNLDKNEESWRVYPLNKPCTIGNEVGKLSPKQFGGLSYEIIEDLGNGVYTIITQSFGKVNIVGCIGDGGSITDKPTYGGQVNVSPSKKYLNLNPSVPSWRVYPLNKSCTVGNEVGKLAPKQFGGLSYEIVNNPSKDIYTIITQSFGKVNIFAPRDNDSSIDSYAKY